LAACDRRTKNESCRRANRKTQPGKSHDMPPKGVVQRDRPPVRHRDGPNRWLAFSP
jgi:hypothetical protein